ncbi:hypothetical protein CK203_096989 [Vitis vinifera]|uniref:Endoplasmic reticulum vesicle transporter N-terminal domain-containing protein n=1 Tax=Vitis vinifera TaxID=29760 RepID=A0A438F8J7_VITVI|nr:hypothetical protein CK203_096989 [Vitis vinifera]
MDNIINKLRNLDAYPKINEDFYSRTLSGGVITLASSIFMLLLFISELSLYSLPRYAYILGFSIDPIFLLPVAGFNSKVTWWKFEKRSGNILLKDGEHGLYLHAVTETKLVVDTSRGETLRINFLGYGFFDGFENVYFMKLQDTCGFASQL